MNYPRRFIGNPTEIAGLNRECSWDTNQESTSTLYATIGSDDKTLQLYIAETKIDGSYTSRSAVTLSRSEALDLMKVLAALI